MEKREKQGICSNPPKNYLAESFQEKNINQESDLLKSRIVSWVN